MTIDFRKSNIDHLDQIANIMFNKSIIANVTDVCRQICLNEDKTVDMDTQTMIDFITVAKECKVAEENISKFITLFEENPDFKK